MQFSITAQKDRYTKHTVWVEARSQKAARRQFQTDYPKEEIEKVCRLKSDAHLWRQIWWRAYQNMPAETTWDASQRRQEWIKVDGKVPLPIFIKQSAKGLMKIEDGEKYRLRKPPRPSIANNKKALLTVLLKYSGHGTFTFQRKSNNKTFNRYTPYWGITNGMAFGVKPKGERAKILMKMARPNGKDYALRKLGRS